MYLESQNVLTVNDGINGTKSVKVKGVLTIEQIVPTENMNIIFGYQYLDDSDPANPLLIEASQTVIDEATQQVLYQAVKADLPDINTSFSAWYQELIYQAFRVEMATTFGIATSEIDIIV